MSTKALVRYANTFLASPLPAPIFVREADGIRYEVLAVEAPFQVERVIAPGGASLKRHVHANVDALEVYESGGLSLQVNDRAIPASYGHARPQLGGRKALVIPRGTPHGPGLASPDGFSFLSIQQHDGVAPIVEGCPHRIWDNIHA